MTRRYPRAGRPTSSSDGGMVHLRPILPRTPTALVAFHTRLSERTRYLRYFGPHPPHLPRATSSGSPTSTTTASRLVALLGDEIIAVGRYGRVPGTDMAEVAFVVHDAHQGRGLGSILLEHLAARPRRRAAPVRGRGAGREPPDGAGVPRRRLPGRPPSRTASTSSSHRPDRARRSRCGLPRAARRGAQRAQRCCTRVRSRSSARAGTPQDRPRGPGQPAARQLHRPGLSGQPGGRSVRQRPRLPHVQVTDIPTTSTWPSWRSRRPPCRTWSGPCLPKQVRALVVMSGGFAEAGRDGSPPSGPLVATSPRPRHARHRAQRLGVANTAPDVRLNATLAPRLPGRGRAGFFSQSGALGVAILDGRPNGASACRRSCPPGTARTVSGNDLLQYWDERPGDRRRPALPRVVRQSAQVPPGSPAGSAPKPILAVKSGGSVAARLAESADPGGPRTPCSARRASSASTPSPSSWTSPRCSTTPSHCPPGGASRSSVIRPRWRGWPPTHAPGTDSRSGRCPLPPSRRCGPHWELTLCWATRSCCLGPGVLRILSPRSPRCSPTQG